MTLKFHSICRRVVICVIDCFASALFDRLEEIEKNELFVIEDVPEPANSKSEMECVAVVDPFSTGAVIAATLSARGVLVIAIYSANMDQLTNLQSLVPKGLVLKFDNVIKYDPDVSKMADTIRGHGYNMSAVIAGTVFWSRRISVHHSAALHYRIIKPPLLCYYLPPASCLL